ncbi:class I SAM-dependent methyltransferase [Prosthecomicrobium sp. N25]|uniref:class I SAM-dependent methyltransferase n=1 Tax=Prosthecomicrobium sp. N25 TaxID=3129254 RepID=UPI003077EC13
MADGPFRKTAVSAKAEPSQDRSIRLSPTPRLDEATVRAAYARWAPVYDFVFGRLALFGRFFDRAREAALAHINTRSGTVLEVGVGTGIALARYRPQLRVTGIDLSPEMLAVARRRVAAEKLDHVEDLLEMDATRLAFPDAAFDTVAVMFTITVVPHPDSVMAEVERVLKPGGEAVVISHFAAEGGWRRALEDRLTPITRKLGWRPDFPVARILNRPRLELVEIRPLPPIGIFSMVRLRRV